MQRVYLDHAATSPLRPEVAEAMARVPEGNPSSAHGIGREAKRALEDAREEIAELLKADPHEVIFTSGGTEADNLALFQARNKTVVVSAIEHAAVLESARKWSSDCRLAPVDANGICDLGSELDGDVAFVSVMAANNEVGTRQDVTGLARRAHRSGALFHTDAVQDPGCYSEADYLTINAHKLGGPVGIGALIARSPVDALTVGGGQEEGRRGGTLNVRGAVGFVTALRIGRPDVTELRDVLADGLVALGGIETVDRSGTVPWILHVRFDGVAREELLLLLDDAGICASAGAACSSGALTKSHVMEALGAPPEGGIRFSLGWTTSRADIDAALDAFEAVLERLSDHRRGASQQ